jgi:hypothetical protein
MRGAAAAPLLMAALWSERVATAPVDLTPVRSEPEVPVVANASDGGNDSISAPPAELAEQASEAQSLTAWLQVKPEADNAEIALRVVNAAAGNPFGLREGDLIVADCGESGRGPDADVSAALAGGYAACLDAERDGERLTLVAMLDAPDGYASLSEPTSAPGPSTGLVGPVM